MGADAASELSDLEAAADAHFQHAIDPEANPDPDLSSGGEGGDGSGSAGSVEPEPTTSPSTDEWSWDDGFKLTKDQARYYAELESFLYANPAAAEAIRNTLQTQQGQQTQATTSPKEEKPAATFPEIQIDEFTDPTVRALYERMQQQEQELAQLRESTTGITDYVSTQQQQTAESLMNRATASFKEQHSLTDDEMGRLTEITARLQILPALMSPVDPISGQVRKVDPLAAIEEALNTAYWQIPEFRDRAISQTIEANNRDRQRKQKLSSLQGSSGSVPREAPIPTTEHERRQAMIAEVAGLMGKDN